MEKPLPVNSSAEQRKELEGAWLSTDGACSIKFDAKGGGRFASLKWDDEKQTFQIDEHLFQLTSINGDLYASLKMNEEGEVAYLLVKCAVGESNLIIWRASPDTFAELIKNNKLKGVIEEKKNTKTVGITTSPEQLAAFLEKSNRKDLFEFEEPIVLQKLGK